MANQNVSVQMQCHIGKEAVCNVRDNAWYFDCD